MSGGPRIALIADAGAAVGGGHVMRSLTLARALAERGSACAFLRSPGVDAVLGVFGPDMPRTSDLEAFDALVIDHYGMSAEQHREIARGRPLLVIDDLANRPLAADVVADAGPHRRAEDYQGKIPAGARLLLGAGYAPVRPQFAALRRKALGRRSGPVARILVSMGLTDLSGITGRVLDRLRPRIGEVSIDVVLGADAPSLPGLERLARRDRRLSIHVDTPDMADLTLAADLAVGAAGSSTWERCVLALPSLLVVVADNQRPAADALAQIGAALMADARDPAFDAAFDRAFQRLFADGEARARIAAKCAEVCDGLGAGRTADAFLEAIASRNGATPGLTT